MTSVGPCDVLGVGTSVQDPRKSSLEREMENYLRGELRDKEGEGSRADLVRDLLNKNKDTTDLKQQSPAKDLSPDQEQEGGVMMVDGSFPQLSPDTMLSPDTGTELSLHTATESLTSLASEGHLANGGSQDMPASDCGAPQDTLATPCDAPDDSFASQSDPPEESFATQSDDLENNSTTVPEENFLKKESVTSHDSDTVDGPCANDVFPSEEAHHKGPQTSPGPVPGLTLSIPRLQTTGSSPSRIPSRKNSSTVSSTCAVLSEDLRRLETRLERYAAPRSGSGSSECSEGSGTSETSGTSGGAGKTSPGSVASRLHSSQTASSRAKASSGSQEKAGSTSPQENKTTSNMLKSTLRKMTRFSMGGKKKDAAEESSEQGAKEEDSQSRSRNPFLNGRSRVPKASQSPGPGVGRSKSFKEPAAPPPPRQNSGGLGIPPPSGSTARNNVYTSSLRRTKVKQVQAREVESGPESSRPTSQFSRSGTGGMERGALRRSVSASRGARGGQGAQQDPANNRLVKKSRPVQTSLTKDPAVDSPDAENPGHVNFQVWLPELLGGGDTDTVETTVTDYSEPVDVRKNRSLTLENMKLSREVERLRASQAENELLKKELRGARGRLEEEQKCRARIQGDLEQYQDRVKVCMESMDSVEQQFESRDLALAQLEGENQRGGEVNRRLRERLGQAEQVIGGQKRELERSLAAQKTLIQQLQESEAEAREMQEFLQAEKGTLSEAMREGEVEIKRLEGELKGKGEVIRGMEEQAGLLVRRAEQSRQELGSARAEIVGLKERAREMLLAQGAELSRASVAISSLTSRLEQMVGEGRGEVEGDQSDKSSDHSEAASDPAANIDLAARRSSQFLITPTDSLDKTDIMSEFSRALMVTSTGSEDQGTLSSLASAITERQQVEAGVVVGSITVPSLVEQISQVDCLLARLVGSRSSLVSLVTSQENIANGNMEVGRGIMSASMDLETLDMADMEGVRKLMQDQASHVSELRVQLAAKDRLLTETREKFGRNRQILTSNWEQAETEVRRLDEIYHDTVDNVVQQLVAVPGLLSTQPGLASLVASFQMREGVGTTDNANKTNQAMSRSLVTESQLRNSNSNLSCMSQSQILLSEACLKSHVSPGPSLPSLLSTDRLAREQDLNANQSL